MADLSPTALRDGLLKLVGRPRSLLVARFVEGRSREALASFYGAPADSIDVLVWRGLGELGRLVEPGKAAFIELRDWTAEQAAARQLSQALSAGAPAAVEPRLGLASAIIAAAAELRPDLVPPPAPPLTRKERWLDGARRLAWLALVIAAAVLYSRWRG